MGDTPSKPTAGFEDQQAATRTTSYATAAAANTTNTNTTNTAGSIRPQEFSKMGVRLSYLGEFIKACGGRSQLEGLSTTEVCQRFIVPWTEATQTSFCEWLQWQEHPAIAPANIFISHAWECCFLDVMAAIVEHMKQGSAINRKKENTANDDPIIWFCLFCNNQHKLDELDFEWFHKTFQSAVADIGHTVMVMSPWDDPRPFTRAWCIWEAYASATNKDVLFEIAMSESDRLKFINDVTKDPRGATDKMLATVRAENSQCFKEEDRKKIFKVIRETVGFPKINSMVFEQYRSWAIRVSTHAFLQSMATVALLHKGQGQYAMAENLLVDCVKRASESLGLEHQSTLAYSNHLACLYMDRGKPMEAHGLVVECLETRRKVLGELHADTLASMISKARWYTAMGQYSDAQPLLEDCLSKRKKSLCMDHPDILATKNQLGSLYMHMKNYKKAQRLYEDCLERRRWILGENHPDFLASMNNLAMLYYRQGKYNKALSSLEESFSKRKEILGEDHPSTMTILNNIASLKMKKGELSEALLLFEACLAKRSATLGGMHPDTLATLNNVNTVSRRLQMVEDSGESEEDGFDNISYCSHGSHSSMCSSKEAELEDSISELAYDSQGSGGGDRDQSDGQLSKNKPPLSINVRGSNQSEMDDNLSKKPLISDPGGWYEGEWLDGEMPKLRTIGEMPRLRAKEWTQRAGTWLKGQLMQSKGSRKAARKAAKDASVVKKLSKQEPP